jgi:hypothetical protein
MASREQGSHDVCTMVGIALEDFMVGSLSADKKQRGLMILDLLISLPAGLRQQLPIVLPPQTHQLRPVSRHRLLTSIPTSLRHPSPPLPPRPLLIPLGYPRIPWRRPIHPAHSPRPPVLDRIALSLKPIILRRRPRRPIRRRRPLLVITLAPFLNSGLPTQRPRSPARHQ